jgi:hypothetical protein
VIVNMKKLISIFLVICCSCGSLAYSQDAALREHAKKKSHVEGQAAAASSTQSVSASMVKWGIAMGIIIGIVCVLVKSSSSHAHS